MKKWKLYVASHNTSVKSIGRERKRLYVQTGTVYIDVIEVIYGI